MERHFRSTPLRMGKPKDMTRRRFLALSTAAGAMATQQPGAVAAISQDKVAGANSRICVGLIGCGRRGTALLDVLLRLAQEGAPLEVAGVCDVFKPQLARARALSGAAGYHRWEELVARSDVDAVLIATPTHWHAPMTLAALDASKDVYCERPMALNQADALAVQQRARESGRVVQIGVERSSAGQWHRARGVIEAGHIGALRWIQAASKRGAAGQAPPAAARATVSPGTLDWQNFLGAAPQRPFDPDRFLGWRKYWDYSGGPAIEDHYDALAPILVATGVQTPRRVSSAGGIYVQDGREVPDALVTNIEYPGGHTVVLLASPGYSRAAAPMIRGQEANIECRGYYLQITPESGYAERFKERFGKENRRRMLGVRRPGHLENWLDCIRTREACVCSPDLGYATQVAVSMAAEAYREGKAILGEAVPGEAAAHAPATGPGKPQGGRVAFAALSG